MRKSFSFCLVILLILSLASCKTIGKSTYENGLNEYLSGDYQKACESYKTAISQGYENGYVYADLAIALLETGETEESDEYIQKALNSASQSALFLKKIGVYYYMKKDTEKSIQYLNQAISATTKANDPDVLEACGIAATIHMEHECYDEAVRLYNYLIEHDDHIMEHTMLGGICYLYLYQFSAARAYFDLLLYNDEMTPYHYLEIYNTCISLKGYEDADVYLNRGLSLLEAGNYEITKAEYLAAAGLYEEAFEAAQGSTQKGDLLAVTQVYLNQKDYDKAEDALLQVFAKDPDSEEAYLLYFLTLIQKGSYEDAKQVYRKLKAFENSSFEEDIAWNEVILFEKMRDYQSAAEKLKNYMTLYHTDDGVRKEMSYLMEQCK